MSRRMLIMLAATLAVFGVIFGLKAFGNRMMHKAFNEMPIPAATVSVAEARAENWPNTLEAVGSIRAVNSTEVTTEAAGIVESIRFTSGQPVEQGVILASLDAEADVADLKSLEAQAKLARLQLDRARRLLDRQVIAKSEVDQRQSEFEATRARVDAQRERVDQKTIRAPFSGELGIRKASVGEYLSPGTGIVSLQTLAPIYLDFNLPEQKLHALALGQAVMTEVDAFPGRRFEGLITAMDPRVDSSTRNFVAQASFTNADHSLRPGMFARVRIDLSGAQGVVVIPQTAVSYNPYGNSVYVIEGSVPAAPSAGKAPGQAAGEQWIVKRRFIKTGRTRGDFIAVTEGLKPGERVASSGLLKLQNDTHVIINNDVQPDAQLKPKPSDG